MRLSITLSALFLLAACGTRGPLELPPGPPPKPLLGPASPTWGTSSSTTRTPAQPQGDDSNKATSVKQ